KSVVIGGSIQEIREITTKKGQKMAFVKIADMMNEIEVVLFPSVYQQTAGTWVRDRVVLVRGKLNARDRQTGELQSDIKILADEAREITISQAEAYQSTGKSVKLPGKRKSAKKSLVSAAKTNSINSDQQRLYIRLVDSSDQELLLKLK